MIRLVAATAGLLLLAGCPTPEPPAEEDVLWDPPLTSSSGGELDFGLVESGDNAQEFITGTNNTDDSLFFTIDVDLEVGEGWIFTSPQGEFEVQSGDDVSFGPRFNPNANTPDEVSGTVAFIWDEEIVTYIIRAQTD